MLQAMMGRLNGEVKPPHLPASWRQCTSTTVLENQEYDSRLIELLLT